MKYKMVCIRDRAADCFGVPNFVVSIGAAIRSFGDEVNRADEKNPLYNHADDFDLYELGEYDDEAADFSLPGPRQIAIGKDLKRQKGEG